MSESFRNWSQLILSGGVSFGFLLTIIIAGWLSFNHQPTEGAWNLASIIGAGMLALLPGGRSVAPASQPSTFTLPEPPSKVTVTSSDPTQPPG